MFRLFSSAQILESAFYQIPMNNSCLDVELDFCKLNSDCKETTVHVIPTQTDIVVAPLLMSQASKLVKYVIQTKPSNSLQIAISPYIIIKILMIHFLLF